MIKSPGSCEKAVHREVKESAEKAGEYEPLYVTEHVVANDFDFPDGFRVDMWPGLMFCQIVTSKQERHVIAWWKSRETFVEAWSKQFADLLGVTTEPSFQGFQRAHRLRCDRGGKLRPAAIVTGVGALVALLTGLSTIQDFGYSFASDS